MSTMPDGSKSRKSWSWSVLVWVRVTALRPYISDAYTTFCDNEAATHALLKGYGKDASINNLLGMFWTHGQTSITA